MPYYMQLQRHSLGKGKHIPFYNDEGDAELTMCPITGELESIEGVLRRDGLANVCDGCGALLEDL